MPRQAKRKSIVWKFFTSEPDKKKAICNYCKKSFKFFGNTTNLKEHLKRVHPFIKLHDDSLELSPSSINSIIKLSTTPENIITLLTHSPSTKSSLSGNLPSPPKRRRQLQLTIHENNRILTDQEIRDIDKSLVEMIVVDYQPTCIVEDKGFIHLCQKLNPKYTLPSRKILNTKLIPQHYDEIRSKLKGDLKNINYISATTDYWQSHNRKSYLGLTIYYIKDFQLNSMVLKTQELTDSYTSENIGDVLKSIFNEYGILDKIITVVTDNAENMKKAVITELSKQHQVCVVHTLNLAVNEIVSNSEQLSKILVKCHSVIDHFKQAEIGLPGLNLKQCAPPGWDSTYIMLENLLELKQPLSVALTELTSNNTPDNLTGGEWSIITDCVMALKSLLLVNEELSSDKYVTTSKIVPLISGLQHKLRSLPTATSIGKDLKVALLDVMSRQLADLEATKLVAKATFLDPRFKKTAFGSNETASNVQQWVTDELTKLISRNQPDLNQNPTSSNNDTALLPLETDNDDLWIYFDRKVLNLTSHSRPTSSATVMVKQYVESQLLPRKEDPLLYWKSHYKIFPELSKMAMKYLSIPAISIPSRLFSKTEHILNARHSK